jgi:glyoxylase-like metal-dependent hydrolase (beta-lactamase superfamily II)
MGVTRIHHLNCGTLCPAGARLVDGVGSLFARGRLVCHCLLVETDSAGLVLIETGIGRRDIADPSSFPRGFRIFANPRFDPSETAYAHVERLGYSPDDVRHVVLTHLDLDHAGGIADFPDAEIHVHQIEYDRAMERPTSSDRMRYLPAQWQAGPRWQTYRDAGDTWFGFEAVKSLRGLDEEIALVPLHGHSHGHSGVAVRDPDNDRWLLHAGDAYFFRGEMNTPPTCPIGLRLFQNLDQTGKELRLANQGRLRSLRDAHSDEVDIFCAHDPKELERYA